MLLGRHGTRPCDVRSREKDLFRRLGGIVTGFLRQHLHVREANIPIHKCRHQHRLTAHSVIHSVSNPTCSAMLLASSMAALGKCYNVGSECGGGDMTRVLPHRQADLLVSSCSVHVARPRFRGGWKSRCLSGAVVRGGVGRRARLLSWK